MSTAGLLRRRALVITFDQLPASILGCYGNEWIDTPGLDRLAARGFVADQCWTSHAGPATADDVFAAAQTAALRMVILQETGTDVDFSQVPGARIRELSGETGSAAKPARIPMAELVRAAQAEWASSSPQAAQLVWLHARGLTVPALPPDGFAELYYDEFEDRAVHVATLPDEERQRHPAASAGMVSLLDHWIGQQLELVLGESAESSEVLVAVTAARGVAWQPMPNTFGPLDVLRSPTTQVPLLICGTGAEARSIPAGDRSSRLLSTRDLGSLLAWWFPSANANAVSWPEWLAGRTAAHQAGVETVSPHSGRRLTTQEWGLILPAKSADATYPAEAGPLLFRKPEDAWEVNNVSSVSLDTVDRLAGQPTPRG